MANKAHINYLSRLTHSSCRGRSRRWRRWCRSSCRSRRSRWWRRSGGQELKLAKLERIPCFPQLFTRASTRGRGSKQLARGQSSNIPNLPFHQKVSIFAEEETFASSMCTSFIEIYKSMIVKLRDPGFAFLPVCHLDSEEDLRPQRTGSIIFCCRPIISVSSSFL